MTNQGAVVSAFLVATGLVISTVCAFDAKAEPQDETATGAPSQPSDPLDELMKELEKKSPGGPSDVNSEREIGPPPSDELRCKGDLVARGSIINLPPMQFEFVGRFDVQKHVFHVAEVLKGDLMKADHDYAIKSHTPSTLTIKAELNNLLVTVEELSFALDSLKISGKGKLSNGYKPLIAKPDIAVDGKCTTNKTKN